MIGCIDGWKCGGSVIVCGLAELQLVVNGRKCA